MSIITFEKTIMNKYHCFDNVWYLLLNLHHTEICISKIKISLLFTNVDVLLKNVKIFSFLAKDTDNV